MGDYFKDEIIEDNSRECEFKIFCKFIFFDNNSKDDRVIKIMNFSMFTEYQWHKYL